MVFFRNISDKIEAETKKGREPVACDLDVTPEGLEPSTH